jgi:ribosomal 50S subunit-associated protein YjgA (DUF615 family)
MTGTVATQVKAIAFDRDIDRLTEGFTGREWVFEEIDRWLQQGNERFFILTGEPGVGKSAIAAQLTQTRKDIAAYHFCIARQISTVEPNNVLLSLAAQLIKYFPDYGEALVNTVKPLFLQVKVEINIENIRDSVVQGVVIENLHIHYPKQALDIVLRQALAALPNPPKEPISILIDSLDEAVTYSNENNLVTLLSSVDDLPSWVRFILTSRPDKQRVLSYFETLKPYYYHLNELSEKNKKDIHQYVDGRVVSEPIQAQIQTFQVQSEDLINQITELSQGNFLYTKVLLDDIELGGQPIDNLATLPKSLNELYHNFLLRLKAEWEGKYQPIFGILTVTKAPVTEEELTNLLSEQLDETELGQRLRVVEQFLDVVQNDYAENTYTLFHQSLQDYLTDKEKSGVFHCSPKDGHRQIIEYCWQYHPRDWRECDRYGLRYLATHLVDMATLEKPPIKARKYIEKLHELLATEVDGRNAWFDAKDRIGETAGFLADVRLAWTKADEEFEKAPAGAIGRQLRYALIFTSINSLANSIPAVLIVALVKKQKWTPAQAFAYIRQVPSSYDRAKTLMELALHFSEPYKHRAFQEVFEVAQVIQSDYTRAYVLIDLTSHLPEVLPEALKAVRAVKDESERAKALVALAPHLPATYLSEVLKVAQTIQDEPNRVKTLTALIPYLPEILPEALKAVRAVKNESERAKTLVVLAPHLPTTYLPEVLEGALSLKVLSQRVEALLALVPYLPEAVSEAFKHSLFISDWAKRKQALEALAPHLSTISPEKFERFSEELNRASEEVMKAILKKFKMVQSIQNEIERAEALIGLIPHLPEALIEAIRVALTIQDDHERLWVLIFLFHSLSKNAKEKNLVIGGQLLDNVDEPSNYSLGVVFKSALKEAFKLFCNAIQNRDEFFYKSQCISALAPYLSESLLAEALQVVLGIPKEPFRAECIAALAPYLSQELLSEVLEHTQSIEDLYAHTTILNALTPHLSEDQLPAALKTAQVINDSYYRTTVLIHLIEHVPANLRQEVLKVVQSMRPNSFFQCMALIDLIPYLPEALAEALKVAKALYKEQGLYRKYEYSIQALAVLTKLVSYVPEASELLLEMAKNNPAGYSRADLLKELAPHLPEASVELLEVARTIKDDYHRAQSLAILVPYFPQCLPEAFNAALAIENNTLRAGTLTSLAPHFPGAVSEALKAALAIEDNVWRAEALAALAPHSPHILPEAIKITLAIPPKDKRRDKVLLALVPYLSSMPEEALKAVQAIQSEYERSKALTTIVSSLPTPMLPEILRIAKTIQDEYLCIQALSVLIPYLPEALSEAIKLAQTIQDEYQHAKALTILVPYLPQIIPAALEAVKAIKDNHSRVCVLVDLVPHVPQTLIEAFAAVQSIEDDEYGHIRLMSDLVTHSMKLPEKLRLIWTNLLHNLARRTRRSLLQNIQVLAPAIVTLGGEEAVEQTVLSILVVGRWWP